MDEHEEQRLSPLPEVTSALVTAGLPFELAAKFAEAAVEAVRQWLWSDSSNCICSASYTDRGLEDPWCRVHDLDRSLGGDGQGIRLTPELDRRNIAATAAALQEHYGEELYRAMFAPMFAKLNAELNGTTVE